MTDFVGTGGNDVLTGTSGDDQFDLTQGGSDTVSGGDGIDTFILGGALDNGDVIDGGAGLDYLSFEYAGPTGYFFNYELGSVASKPLNYNAPLTSIERLSLKTGATDDYVTFIIPTTAGGYGARVPYFDGGAGFDDFTMNFYSDGFQGQPPYPIVTGYNITHSPSTFAAWQLKPDGTKGELLVQADNVEKLHIEGTSLNDQINGTDNSDVISPVYGNDTVKAGGGDDFIFMWDDAFTSSDTIDGGAGNDQLWVGTAHSTLRLTPTMLVNVEKLVSIGSGPLNVVTDDATVAAGQTMTIDATAQQPIGTTLTFDGSAEKDGSFIVLGSINADSVVTGGGVDTLTGGAGNDNLNGGSNVDTAMFSGNSGAYAIAQPSTGTFTLTGPDGSDTLTNIEYAKFDDKTLRLLPGTGSTVNFALDPSTYMGAIRDFDGNDLGGAASWKLIGTADVNGDGSAEHILFNRQIGRWAEVGSEADGKTYFANNGWAGDTRVVGIYIDPLVTQGIVQAGSDTDSQRRFQNDLQIDNIKSVLGQGDYNHDGLQEIYFSLTDGTAYLHAYMHADGNIQYANYQNKQQVIDYLTTNGVAASTWSTWFPASQAAPDMMSGMTGQGSSGAMLAAGG